MFSSVALLLFFLAGIPWGPVGIAWAHVWSSYLLLVPRLYWSFKGTPISMRLFFSSIAKPLAASAVMGIILVLLRQARLVQGAFGELCLGIVASALVYFGLWMVMPGGRSELRDLIADLTGPINFCGFFRRKAASRTLPVKEHLKIPLSING
jgi:polysaccharide transporter, PST family